MYNDIVGNAEAITEIQQQLPYSNLHLSYYFMNGWFKHSTACSVILDMTVFCITIMLMVFFLASLIEILVPAILKGFRLVAVNPLTDLRYTTVLTKNHKTLNHRVPEEVEVPAHNLAKDGIFRIIEIRKIGKIYSVKEYCIFDVLNFVNTVQELGKILADYETFTRYCRPVKTLYVSAKLDKHLYLTPSFKRGSVQAYPDLRKMPVDEKLKYLKKMLDKSLILIPSIDKKIVHYFLPLNTLTSIRQFKEIVDECYLRSPTYQNSP